MSKQKKFKQTKYSNTKKYKKKKQGIKKALKPNVKFGRKVVTYSDTIKYKKKKKGIKKALKSTIIFDQSIAIRLSDPRYYIAMGQEVINLHKKEAEKLKYSRPRQTRVTQLIEKYKQTLYKRKLGSFFILKGIYNKNKKAAQEGKEPPMIRNIHSVAFSIPMLITAYAKIRRNKGAMTLGAMLSYQKYKWLNPLQTRFLSKTAKAPDGLTYQTFADASTLLNKGLYPWGASRRIYIDKPGQPGKLRPITIPPFMDRVVQTSIKRVLEAIYEPWFEKLNRSFGFRPHKGVHDAIYHLTRRENRGLKTAIEGDVKGAYDKVIQEKLISILEKRIQDRKFINTMKQRLNYIYFDSSTNKYQEDQKGIPQGGIDSPYLWNIYMQEFDIYIDKYLTDLLTQRNNKLRMSKKTKEVRTAPIMLPEVKRLQNLRAKIKDTLRFLTQNPEFESTQIPKNRKQEIKKIQSNKENYSLQKDATGNITLLLKPSVRHQMIKEISKINHRLRKLPPQDPNRLILRHQYCRYADDWIILGNFNIQDANSIKEHIAIWLKENLGAELSMEKTMITDIRKDSAHFLGFELKAQDTLKSGTRYNADKGITESMRSAGQEVNAWPDKQRLISRLHMKGYCDEDGKPTGMRWLSSLETFVIIERFNAVLRGLANYYNGFLHFPSSLSRWIYIIRRCAINTIARKFNITAKKVYKKFGTRTAQGKTISCTVTQKIKNRGKLITYKKVWRLLTYKDLIKVETKRYEEIKQTFISIENKNILPSYKTKEFPIVTNDDYLNKIIWVNLRTQASFDLPCCLCGSSQQIEMHHIRHFRKSPYYDLPTNKPWLQMMALRNRKQIPVCRDCHMNKIHRGTYQGANLKTLSPHIELTDIGYDLTLINIENYINPSQKEYFAKTLEEKGWVKQQEFFLAKRKKNGYN